MSDYETAVLELLTSIDLKLGILIREDRIPEEVKKKVKDKIKAKKQ